MKMSDKTMTVDGVTFDAGLMQIVHEAYYRSVTHKELRESDEHGEEAREAEDVLSEHLESLSATPERLVATASILLARAERQVREGKDFY